MAKDKVDVEIEAVLGSKTLGVLKDQFSNVFSEGMSRAKLLGGAALGLGAIATAPIGMAKGAEAMLGAFTNAFNPAAMQQFSLAISDTVAVIGEMLVPVVESLVPLIRTWGDFLASILPSQEELKAVLNELNPLFNEMRNLLAIIAPDLRKLLSETLVEFAKAFRSVSEVMMDIMRQMAGVWADLIVKINAATLGQAGNMDLARKLYQFSIMEPGKGKDLEFGNFSRSSVGKAAGGASSMGFAGLSEKLVMASLGMGGNPQLEEAKKANAQLEQINGKVDEVIKAAQAAGGAAHLFNGGRNN